MTLPAFEYAAPATIEEAIALRRDHGDDAVLMAGGLILVILMRERMTRPQIVVDDVPMDRYGLDWLEIAPGPHTVCFTHVEGYTEPGCQDVNVTAGATTTVTGTFTQRGFLRVLTSPALPGTITINGLPANDWGLYTDLPVGTYNICWGFVAGHFIPACQQATISAGQTTTKTGTYG